MFTPTIYQMFLAVARRYPDHAALKYRQGDMYAEIRYGELSEQVNIVADNLHRLGIGTGDAVGIFSGNRPEWVLTDLAALKLGACVVPLYPSTPAALLQYIITDSRMKLIVVENGTLYSVLFGIVSQTPSLKQCIIMESGEDADHNALDFRSALLQSCGAQIECRSHSAQDIATVVYTSGTTGNPKGVMLSHENIVSNAQAVMTRFRVTPDDVTVSYLPLCHMFERTCGYYAVLFGGGTIAYAECISTVAADVAKIRPTILIAVPRVIEKAFEAAVQRIHDKSRMEQWLVSAAMRILNDYANRQFKHDRIPLTLRIKHALFHRIVGSTFRQLAGGRLRLIASGGAPLDRKVAKAFHILGFNIVEGYGLTEASPVVSCNSPFDNVLGTVGKPMDGVQVKIAGNQEILVKGPNVMLGYCHDPASTASVVDGDGWLHTGDMGRFDERGNLLVTGRIKDIIVTSYGKNIAPAAIEAMILRSPFVRQVVIFGDKRKHLSALVVPDPDAAQIWMRRNGCNGGSARVFDSPEFRELIAHELNQATRDCAPYEKPKDFRIIPEEFTIENGLLTPTLKPRRTAIAEKYRDEIESMYHKDPEVVHAR